MGCVRPGSPQRRWALFCTLHLAPKFPPELLNSALATFLPLEDDELLLALIDSGGPKPVRRCALTTRRVYWTDWADQGKSRDRMGLPSPIRSRTHQLVVRVADYAHLPKRMQAVIATDGWSGVDLGNSTVIVVGKCEGLTGSGPVRYLETMGKRGPRRCIAARGRDRCRACQPGLRGPAGVSHRSTATGRASPGTLGQFRSLARVRNARER